WPAGGSRRQDGRRSYRNDYSWSPRMSSATRSLKGLSRSNSSSGGTSRSGSPLPPSPGVASPAVRQAPSPAAPAAPQPRRGLHGRAPGRLLRVGIGAIGAGGGLDPVEVDVVEASPLLLVVLDLHVLALL